MIDRTVLSLIVSSLFFPVIAFAQGGYQYEGVMAYTSTDDEDFIDTTVFGVSITMFMEPVSYGDKPYNESGFLARKSNVTLALGQIEYEIDLGFGDVDIDTTAMSANGEYMLSGSSVVLGAGFTMADGDKNFFGSKLEVTLQEVSVSVGYYLDPLSKIGLTVKNSELEFDVSGGGGGTLDTDTVLAEYIAVTRMDNGNYAGMHARLARIEIEDIDIDVAQLGGDYYFSRSTSVGTTLGYLSSDEEGVGGNSLALRFRHFVDRLTSVSLEYEQFNGDGSGGDSDTTSIKILHRY